MVVTEGYSSPIFDLNSDWEKNLNQAILFIQAMRFANVDRQHLSKKIFSCIDLTSLNDTDTPQTIADLAKKSSYGQEHVAAICVYSKFLPQVLFLRAQGVHMATVANFPGGDSSIESVCEEIKAAIAQGADEVDVVFPYRQFLDGGQESVIQFLKHCRQAAPDPVQLKIILETGFFSEIKDIFRAAVLCYECGADFTKTSTGKISQGATLESVGALLFAAKYCQNKYSKSFGVKVSGGVRTFEQAAGYLMLAREVMGGDVIGSKNFRIGASQLIDSLSLHLLP